MASSIGFRIFSFLLSCYSSYGALTFTPVGLTPTVHASLRWTHTLSFPTTCRFYPGVPTLRDYSVQTCLARGKGNDTRQRGWGRPGTASAATRSQARRSTLKRCCSALLLLGGDVHLVCTASPDLRGQHNRASRSMHACDVGIVWHCARRSLGNMRRTVRQREWPW